MSASTSGKVIVVEMPREGMDAGRRTQVSLTCMHCMEDALG